MTVLWNFWVCGLDPQECRLSAEARFAFLRGFVRSWEQAVLWLTLECCDWREWLVRPLCGEHSPALAPEDGWSLRLLEGQCQHPPWCLDRGHCQLRLQRSILREFANSRGTLRTESWVESFQWLRFTDWITSSIRSSLWLMLSAFLKRQVWWVLMFKLESMKEKEKDAGSTRSAELELLHTGCQNIRNQLGRWRAQPHTSPDRCAEKPCLTLVHMGEKEREFICLAPSGLIPTDQFALIKICSLYQAREVWGILVSGKWLYWKAGLLKLLKESLA